MKLNKSWNFACVYETHNPNIDPFFSLESAYRKFTLDATRVMIFAMGGNIRDLLLENYMHALKFSKITTYRGYNKKNTSMGKNHDSSL